MIGEHIFKYAVIEEIGRGGMGVVYRAHDSHLRRDVALKVLSPDRTQDSRRQRRFINEARAASSLAHPGIVTVFDIVRHRESDVMVMELIQGGSLRSELQRVGKFPWRRATEIGCQLAEAMGAAHRGGIVHRDLKPENVMLSIEGRIKVLDFGLAKLDPIVTPGPGEDTETLISGLDAEAEVGAGTVAYMAPEQALGEAVDPRSDVFAFGVMLYEMLTGNRPFLGATPLATLRATIFDSPANLETFEELPLGLCRLVEACLEKKPSNRPADLAAVSHILTGLQRSSNGNEGTSTAAEVVLPDSLKVIPEFGPKRSGPKRSGPKRRWSGLAAGLFSALALAGWVWMMRIEAGQGAFLSQSNKVHLETGRPEIASAYPAYLQGRRLLERYDRPGHIDQAIDILSHAVELDPRLAVGYAALSEAFWRKYRVDNADSMWIDRAESHAQQAVKFAEHLAVSQLAQARVWVERDEIEAALEALARAELLDPLNPMIPLIRGRAAEKGQDLGGAVVAYRRAIELEPIRREAHDSLGTVLFRRARYEEAEAAFRRSVELAPDSYIGHRNLAGALQMQGRHDEAASQLQRSLEIQPTWSAYTNLGTLQFFRGLYGDAISAFEKAIELGANDYIAWANLGDAYRFSSARRGAAAGAFRRAIQLAGEELADTSTDVELRSRIALYHAKSDNGETALAMIGEIDLSQADASLLGRSVVIFELTGRRSAALSLLARALEAGYPIEVIEGDPELEGLRRDVEYHQFLAGR